MCCYISQKKFPLTYSHPYCWWHLKNIGRIWRRRWIYIIFLHIRIWATVPVWGIFHLLFINLNSISHLDKMAAILSDGIFRYILLNENVRIPIKPSLKSVPRSPIDKNLALESMDINGSGNGLAPNRRQVITWTNDDPVHWRIYAALGEMS